MKRHASVAVATKLPQLSYSSSVPVLISRLTGVATEGPGLGGTSRTFVALVQSQYGMPTTHT